MAQPAPRPATVVAPKSPARIVAAPDWFQHQLAAAREARRSHRPHSDVAGARQAYYRLALAACSHIAEHGLTKYRGRCNALRQQAVVTVPPPSEDAMCDEGADDPDKVTACND
jgi:hypothetical protein